MYGLKSRIMLFLNSNSRKILHLTMESFIFNSNNDKLSWVKSISGLNVSLTNYLDSVILEIHVVYLTGEIY